MPRLKPSSCLEFTPENLGYTPANRHLFRFVPHCGYIVINLSYTNGDARGIDGDGYGQMALFCLACKPGYKPELNQFYNSSVVKKCNPIQHCIGRDWANSCSECAANFSYQYSDGRIDFTVCLKNSVSFCYAATEQRCMVCERGYQLDAHSNCVPFNLIQCESNYQFTKYSKITRRDLQWKFYLHRHGVGCNKCLKGHYGVQLRRPDSFLCFPSPQDAQGSIIENCRSLALGAGGEIRCEACLPHYAPSRSGLECVFFPNCLQMDQEGRGCAECAEGFAMENLKCRPRNILHCKAYQQVHHQITQVCLSCLDGYVLVHNSCLRGKVKNCRRFKTLHRCLECLENYFLFQGTFYDHCFYIPTSLQCSQASLRQNSDGRLNLECSQCQKRNFSLQNLSLNDFSTSRLVFKSQCLSVDVQSHCSQYHTDSPLMNQKINCTQCEKGFYLESSQCK